MQDLSRWLWRNRLVLLAGLTGVFVVASYAFFITAGQWNQWPETKHYYDQLAQAFRDGRLDIGVVPSSSFAALADPYDPQNWRSDPALKAFADTVWDASYYRGKFYLYWGPTPAIFLALLRQFTDQPIGDPYFVFIFLTAAFVASAALLIRLAQRFYSDIPTGMILLCILVAGFAAPIPWMLSRPAIYEAAIVAGQFFLLAGLYSAIAAIDAKTVSKAGLLMASLLWALAVGSRLTTIIPIGFLVIMIFFRLLQGKGDPPARLTSLQYAAALGAPLAVGLLSLAWYNWARFGSVFETGLHYQVTSTDLNAPSAQIYSYRYVLPNLWFYLFNPLVVKSRFPFLELTYGPPPGFVFADGLSMYHLEKIAGLLFTVPFVLFSLIAIGKTILRVRRGSIFGSADNGFAWSTLCLEGAGILSLLSILPYFYVTMRFQDDFVPLLVLVSAIGSWQAYQRVQARPARRFLLEALIFVLAMLSMLMSSWVPIAVNYSRYQRLNPQLFKWIMRAFSR